MGPAPQMRTPRPSSSRVLDMPCMTTERGSRRAPCANVTLSGSLSTCQYALPDLNEAQTDLCTQRAGWTLYRCSEP
jgi:hypothetical protein